LGVESRLREKSSLKTARVVFAAAALLPTDFEEAGRAGRKGEAATVARRLLGQFI
jgi:hypothetical protein